MQVPLILCTNYLLLRSKQYRLLLSTCVYFFGSSINFFFNAKVPSRALKVAVVFTKSLLQLASKVRKVSRYTYIVCTRVPECVTSSIYVSIDSTFQSILHLSIRQAKYSVPAKNMRRTAKVPVNRLFRDFIDRKRKAEKHFIFEKVESNRLVTLRCFRLRCFVFFTIEKQIQYLSFSGLAFVIVHRLTYRHEISYTIQKPQTKSAPASVNVSEVQSPTSVSNQPVSTPQSISSVYTLKPPISSQAACEMSCEEDSLLSQTTSSTSGYRENCSLLMMQLESPREMQHCYPSSSNSTLVPPVSPESFESDDNIRSSQHSVLMVYGSQDKNTML